jgi:hypothetical protein
MATENRITWRPDTSRGCLCDVASLCGFEMTITEGGAGTVGCNLYVGTFAGRVAAISASREACEGAIIRQARRELLRAGRALDGGA